MSIWRPDLTIFYGFASSRSVETTNISADVVFREFRRQFFSTIGLSLDENGNSF